MVDILIIAFLIILGIYWIWLTSKEPVNTFFSVTFKGYVFGVNV